MSTTIYYFTGTGNSLTVAKDIATNLEDAEIIRICQNTLDGDLKPDSQNVGIITPVYFSGPPVIVKDFIEKLQVEKDAYIFAVATYGDSVAIVFSQIKKLLERKGLKLSGAFGVRMPHNFHAPISPEKQEEYFKNEKEMTALIANNVKNNDNVLTKSYAIKNITSGIIYNLTQRSGNFDKNFTIDDQCIGCTTCAKVCPANNIVMKDGKPQWQHKNKCQLCVACLQWCPKQAIQYGKTKIPSYRHPNIKTNDLF
jgi:Flavodoxins